ncbi:hypothetical protein PspLS_08923 [Pyricularia sp. CBS 133598]|nr:hypothetical protein PspLS_08923 [Pyricularia sp. CBS 133598]
MYRCRKALVNLELSLVYPRSVNGGNNLSAIRHVSCWFRAVGNRRHEIIPFFHPIFLGWIPLMVVHPTVSGTSFRQVAVAFHSCCFLFSDIYECWMVSPT